MAELSSSFTVGGAGAKRTIQIQAIDYSNGGDGRTVVVSTARVAPLAVVVDDIAVVLSLVTVIDLHLAPRGHLPIRSLAR
jgi:hypothetical protein